MSDSALQHSDIELIKEFVKRLINLEEQKNALRDDIKSLKDEYSEQGVAVKMVCKALNEIKKNKRVSYTEQSEIEYLVDLLSSDKEIDGDITSLISR